MRRESISRGRGKGIAAPRHRPERGRRAGSGRFARIPFVLTLCLLLVISLSTFVHVAHADPLDDEARRIGKQLQCPVCSGASVAESPSELAGQMRMVIRSRLEAGENEDQIVAYFVERYGDSVLIEPPRRGFGLAVWLAPIGVLAVGAVVLWSLLKTWLRPRRSPVSASPAASPTPYRNGTAHADEPASISTVDRARAELDRFRREA